MSPAMGWAAIPITAGIAFAMLSRVSVLRRLATVYVSIIRNTPILVLVLFTYFALPHLT